MPVTKSFKWNRIPEDFEEYYGAEMQPFLNPAFNEEEEVPEVIPMAEPEIMVPLINIEQEKPGVFSVWLKLMIGKIKGSNLRFRYRS